jgi:DNA-binding CsgD family transcriptional regulator
MRGLIEGAAFAHELGPERGRAAIAIARRLGDPALLGRLLLMHSMSLTFLDPHEALAAATEVVALSRLSGDGLLISPCLAWQGTIELTLGDSTGIETLRDSVAVDQQVGGTGHLARSVLCAWLAWRGEVEDAIVMAQGVLAEAQDTQLTTRLFALFGLAQARALRGELEAAARAADDLLELGRRLGTEPLEAFGWIALGSVALARGDSQVAANHLQLAARCARGLRAVGAYTWPILLADALRAAGDVAGARATIDGFVTEARSLVLGAPLGRGLRSSARIALTEGDAAAAEDMLHEALMISSEHCTLTDVADELELLGVIAAEEESALEAARLFGAVDRWRDDASVVRTGADEAVCRSAWARCKSLLSSDELQAGYAQGQALSLNDAISYARRGRGERKRPSVGWASLTPSEERVSRLVAEGLSNKDIAARLFISPRTVQSHLSRVFAKLNLESRVQLARLASQQGS